MSIQTEIDRINASVASAYAVLDGLGATMPNEQNVDNLAATTAAALTNMKIGARNLIRSSANLQNKDYYFSSGKSAMATKTVSGEVVTISDASPEEHDLSVNVSGVDDPASVTVYRYGKNLFDPNKLLQVSDRNTYDEATGLWTMKNVSGWCSSILYNVAGANSARDITKLVMLPSNAKVTVKLFSLVNGTSLGNSETIQCSIHDSTGAFVTGYKGFDTFTFTTPSAASWLDIRRYNNSGTVSFSGIQIEVGSNATAFSEFVEPQTVTPNGDGAVDGITSLYPYMTIFADSAGATVSVTYNRVAALASVTGTSPNGKAEEMALFTVDELPESFVMPNIKNVGEEYTLSLWLKSEGAGRMTVNGTSVSTSSAWTKYVVTYTAASKDLTLGFGTVGTYYIYHPQLEIGKVATDWRPAVEDTARVDDCALILQSCTDGSTKKFRITVDDFGAIRAVEI